MLVVHAKQGIFHDRFDYSNMESLQKTLSFCSLSPSSPRSRLVVRFVEFQHVTHVFLAAEEYGTPFVDVLRNEVEDALRACRRKPSRLSRPSVPYTRANT